MLLTSWNVLDVARDPRAPEVPARARSTLREAAERIGGEAMAERFLRTPLHARLMAAVPEHGPRDGVDGVAQAPCAAPGPG